MLIVMTGGTRGLGRVAAQHLKAEGLKIMGGARHGRCAGRLAWLLPRPQFIDERAGFCGLPARWSDFPPHPQCRGTVPDRCWSNRGRL